MRKRFTAVRTVCIACPHAVRENPRGKVDAKLSRMSEAQQIHCYEYVNQPYERVSEALVIGGVSIFQRATTTAAVRATSIVSTLKWKVANVEIGRDVRIKVERVNRHAHVPRLAANATTLELEWHAEKDQALFPAMHATLLVYPLSATETQLELVGSYDPPGGVVGAAADRIIGHRIAEAVAHRFLDDVATRLGVELHA